MGELRGLGEGRVECSTHVGVFLARSTQAEDGVNVERLEIGIGFVRRLSVCVGEGEEEMGELLFAWFLVVSELGGEGGHVSVEDTDSLALPQTATSPRTQFAYVIPHLASLFVNAQRLLWVSSILTVSDIHPLTDHELIQRVDYLTGGKHIQSFPLSVLSDTRLGIDASYYLQSIYENLPGKEPLLSATGGLPLALTQRIETDLRTLEKLRIKPVFVFSGLIPQKRWKHVQPHLIHEQNEACRDRANAWSRYEASQEEAATKLFEVRSGLHQWDLWRMVLRIFRHRNVEFIVAPYLAWAQVSVIRLLRFF